MPYTAHPVWSFPVNWAAGVLERLEWKTDVMSSELGQEQRVSRRPLPRRTFEVEFLLNVEERQHANTLLSVHLGKEFVIPIWHDVVVSTVSSASNTDTLYVNTNNREFDVGQLVFIRGKNSRKYEVGTVESKTGSTLKLVSNLETTWPIGTRVYPAKLGRFASDVKPKKQTDRVTILACAVMLTSPSIVDSSWVPNYKNLPVIRFRPEDSDEHEFEYARSLALLDNMLGKPDVYDILGAPMFRQTHSWAITGSINHADLRRLLYNLKGRLKAVYLPSFMNDLTLASPIVSTDTFIDIVNVGITDNSGIVDGRRDIRIQARNGNVSYREILSSTVISADVERLALNDSVGLDIPLEDIVAISYMMIVRLDQDSVEISHVTDVEGLTICRVTFFGPTQGTPLPNPLYVSRPYPVFTMDSLEVSGNYAGSRIWGIDRDGLDLTADITVSMPTVVSYETYEELHALDMTADITVSMPTVVSYETYNELHGLDMTATVSSVSMPEVPRVTYVLDDEALDLVATLTGVSLT